MINSKLAGSGVRSAGRRGISAAVKRQDRVQIMLAGLILPVLAVVAALASAFGHFAGTAWLFATGLGVAVWYVLGWFIYLAVASRATHPAWLRNSPRTTATYRHATLTTTTLARG